MRLFYFSNAISWVKKTLTFVSLQPLRFSWTYKHKGCGYVRRQRPQVMIKVKNICSCCAVRWFDWTGIRKRNHAKSTTLCWFLTWDVRRSGQRPVPEHVSPFERVSLLQCFVYHGHWLPSVQFANIALCSGLKSFSEQRHTTMGREPTRRPPYCYFSSGPVAWCGLH